MSTQTIPRADWESVRNAFRAFFDALGTVEVTDDVASFRSGITGFSVAADGTSESFMPLHRVSLGWDEVAFDHEAWEVRLHGPAGSYTYVVPPELR